MESKLKLDQSDFELRAHWYKLKYGVDEKRVAKILSTLKVERCQVCSESYFDYLEFSPSLECALELLRPEVALRIFEHQDHVKIQQLIELLIDLYDEEEDHEYAIETLCLMESTYFY